MGIRTITLALIIHLLSVAPAAADDRAAADALNSKARAAYDAGDFSGALDLFKEAWGKARLPKYLFNAAKTCLRLENPEAALHYFRRYLDAAPAAGDRAAVEEEMEGLRTQLHHRSLVRLDILTEPPGAAYTLDGQAHPEIPRSPAERWLPAGNVLVAATMEGRLAAEETVALAPDRAARVRLVLAEVPRPARLVVDCPPGAEVRLGDQIIAPGQALELDAGNYTLKVEQSGHQPWMEELMLAPGEEHRVVARPLPLPPPGRSRAMKIAGWSTLAAGGAALVAGAVLTGIGAKQMKDANTSHASADGAYVRDYGRGRDLYHGGLGTLGAGGAAVITGGLLLLLK